MELRTIYNVTKAVYLHLWLNPTGPNVFLNRQKNARNDLSYTQVCMYLHDSSVSIFTEIGVHGSWFVGNGEWGIGNRESQKREIG